MSLTPEMMTKEQLWETIEALRGEVATLTTQNTAWLDKYGDCQNQMYAAIERAEKAEAEAARLRQELDGVLKMIGEVPEALAGETT